MKNKKLNILIALILVCTIFMSYATPIFAETSNSTDDNIATTDDNDDTKTVDNAVDVDLGNVKIGDQFQDSEGTTYTVVDDAANIYVGSGSNQKHYKTGSVDTFEITYKTSNGNATYGVNDPSAVDTWRKYIKLEDLCSLTKEDGTYICEIMDETDYDAGEFYLKRLYKEKIYESIYYADNDIMDAQEISLYYNSYHTTKSKQFKSLLVLKNENSDNENDTESYFFTGSDEKLEEAGKWDNNGYMTTDIETLIDKKGEVYVSLRFVSESLGAEVRWLSEDDSKDGSDDDVYIEFYDDKEYCKDIEYTITTNGEERDPKDIEKALYQKEGGFRNLSLDGTYKYTDSDGKKKTSTIDWQNIYMLLTIPENYPNGFFDDAENLPLSERIVWITENEENYLRLRGNVYGKYSDGQCQVGNTTYECDLGEEVSLTGILLYKGVPIPIDLFNINSEMCTNS